MKDAFFWGRGDRFIHSTEPERESADGYRIAFNTSVLLQQPLRGVGGEVGPALDREGSLSSLFTTAQLREYVRHDGVDHNSVHVTD